ncbi:MAG: class I SAM-dependent methyltransferase [Candidatus Marinimicrobia bacterium]|jgi:ubiquinone/menaquinone biosynthesis C-methylase UbiE|nr:class I SAM-dependent methyltransferase [Candidatus Neomarinimicrobiota bacterium]MDP6789606.1 class I SAM-dependent methyltransferase [Candidatus Neomarinimicrobiota bacterium]
MISKLFSKIIHLSPTIRRTIWKWWYQKLASKHVGKNWRFMNYGYAQLNGSSPIEFRNEEDKEDRYFIQLYHHVASEAAPQGKKVLEVGSGRGGGSWYVASYLHPEHMTGLDYSENAVELANGFFKEANLNYVQGDAESLPFESESFDAVINVESSHCYGSMESFVSEVYRVLKPGGIFSWADLRGAGDVEELDSVFDNSGLTKVKDEVITENVIKALDGITERKEKAIHQFVPGFIRSAFSDFAAVKGSRVYNSFAEGRMVYLSKVFHKS